jgi:hypothetical protein
MQNIIYLYFGFDRFMKQNCYLNYFALKIDGWFVDCKQFLLNDKHVDGDCRPSFINRYIGKLLKERHSSNIKRIFFTL